MEPELDTDGILDLIAREAEVERAMLTLDRGLEELGITSLQMISVLFAIEDLYKVTITPDEIRSAETLGDLVTLARGRMQA